ncbi:UNVERIFIED_CONTAM: hypothetical protein PYX00_009754 [Menopon gallinae]|uniref:KIF-binding protein n=1 Tax=Menopon gallinae TaxID=328185 RepID=A0AAW2HCV2_9NEOP
MDVKVFQILHEQYEKLKADIKGDKIGSEGECSWDSNPAKALLEEMTGKILELIRINGKSGRHYYRLLAMEGALHYQHAKVLVRLNKPEKAKEILKYAMESLKEYFLVPEVTFLGLRVLNHYCYLLTKCGDLEKSQELLEFAEARYTEMKSKKDGKFYSNDDLFDAAAELKSSKEVGEKLERLVTNNLQMLGFVYSKQGKMDKFAVYHHEVLRRQLDMREGDATVWAMKTARLGYFFITRNKFAQARHHLAAACYVLSQYESTLKTLETSDLVLAKWEELNHRYADIAKCWVKYGLFLFNASRLKLVSTFYGDSSPLFDTLWANPLDRFMYGSNPRPEEDEIDLQSVWNCDTNKNPAEGLKPSEGTTNLKNPVDGEQSKSEGASKSSASLHPASDIFDVIFRNNNPSNVSIGVLPTDLGQGLSGFHFANESEVDKNGTKESQEEKDFRFPNLDLSCFENCVTCSYVDNLQAARGLFLFTHSWLKKSKLFYTLKDHPMEYVNVILDLSELYRYLAFYEDDIENQYSLQKRRAETLETLSTVLKELRPQCYIAVSVELLRELAEVHLELMSLNIRRLYLTHSGPPKAECKSSPQYFTDLSEETMRKMKAVADMHLRLNKGAEWRVNSGKSTRMLHLSLKRRVLKTRKKSRIARDTKQKIFC